MKKFLVILVFIVVANAIDLEYLRSNFEENSGIKPHPEINNREEKHEKHERLKETERYARYILEMLDKYAKQKSEASNEELQKLSQVKRQVRDVAHLPEVQAGEETNAMKTNETAQEMTCPAMFLEPRGKRAARDLLHMLKDMNDKQIEDSIHRSTRSVAHLAQRATNLSLLQGIIHCLEELTDEEEANAMAPNVHHTPQEVAEDIIEHVGSHDHLERDPNDHTLKWKAERADKQGECEKNKEKAGVPPVETKSEERDENNLMGETTLPPTEEIGTTQAPQEVARLVRQIDHMLEMPHIVLKKPNDQLETPHHIKLKEFSESSGPRRRRDVVHVIKSKEASAKERPNVPNMPDSTNSGKEKRREVTKRQISSEESSTVSTASPQTDANTSTSSSTEANESPKPTAKARLPLTAFAVKRNTVLKNKKKPSEEVVAQTPKVSKKRI
uniref:Uncharacterized protein n=1 Tax=Stomoxys calcitrans TaxID=35570 RepID=A0A1I8NPT2_STOCA